LHVPARDEVEGHVDATFLGSHGPGVLVDSLLVEGVEDGHLCQATRGGDVGGDRLQRLAGAAGKKDPRAFPGELFGDRAAYGSAPSVDHGVFAFE
jgi:hypothetical protein